MVSGLIELLVAAPADAHRAALVEATVTDARRLVAAPADGQHVGEVDGRFLLDDPARLLHPTRFGMALHQVDPLDDHAVLVAEDAQHLACLSALAPCDDHHGVVFAQPLECHAQMTSGASEMIFMNFFARSSRATGPKMRVPMGSLALS